MNSLLITFAIFGFASLNKSRKELKIIEKMTISAAFTIIKKKVLAIVIQADSFFFVKQ